jgi:undecaprenyl diphosphate synthase
MSQPKPVQCIGIILDGNRRWAKEKGLPTMEGHRRGFELLKEASRWVRDRGIPHFVVFAFSTENWNRSEEEVSYLMDIFRDAIRESGEELGKEGIRVRFAGQRDRFSDDIRKGIEETEEKTHENSRMTLWICLSYGGRAEIVAAAEQAAAHEGLLTEELIRQHMWTADMPDPDIIIRTGGAQRLSNFLLWQSAYSELFFLEPYWPDFSEKTLDSVLAEYVERERRMGK